MDSNGVLLVLYFADFDDLRPEPARAPPWLRGASRKSPPSTSGELDERDVREVLQEGRAADVTTELGLECAIGGIGGDDDARSFEGR